MKSKSISVSFQTYLDILDYMVKKEKLKPIKQFIEEAVRYYIKNKKD